MPSNTDTKTQALKIDFLQDTLFGVNTFSIDCMAQFMPQATFASATLRLLITPPWPSPLEDAHAILLRWDSEHYKGTVQTAQQEPDGRLLLTIVPRP